MRRLDKTFMKWGTGSDPVQIDSRLNCNCHAISMQCDEVLGRKPLSVEVDIFNCLHYNILSQSFDFWHLACFLLHSRKQLIRRTRRLYLPNTHGGGFGFRLIGCFWRLDRSSTEILLLARAIWRSRETVAQLRSICEKLS